MNSSMRKLTILKETLRNLQNSERPYIKGGGRPGRGCVLYEGPVLGGDSIGVCHYPDDYMLAGATVVHGVVVQEAGGLHVEA